METVHYTSWFHFGWYAVHSTWTTLCRDHRRHWIQAKHRHPTSDKKLRESECESWLRKLTVASAIAENVRKVILWQRTRYSENTAENESQWTFATSSILRQLQLYLLIVKNKLLVHIPNAKRLKVIWTKCSAESITKQISVKLTIIPRATNRAILFCSTKKMNQKLIRSI